MSKMEKTPSKQKPKYDFVKKEENYTMDNNKDIKDESKSKLKLIENMKNKSSKLAKIFTTTSLADIIQVNKWWEQPIEEGDSETKWTRLEHNGVLVAPRYEPHGVKILFKGNPIELRPYQEELATFWAGLANNELASKKITRINFLKEFKSVLDKEYKDCSLEDFDFTPIIEYIENQREKNKNRSPEEKKSEKDKKQKIMEQYGYALVDGLAEKISNYLVEPPGIFRGRGEHPKSGRIKKRILPEDVTLNIGPDDPVPICDLPGHSWGEIVYNNEATWIAQYRDKNNDKSTKYIFLAANSKFKGMNDFKKYEKARRLKNYIGKIREDYTKKLDEGFESRQLGVATYLIDVLALRVGNEKGDDEADTVGCCSLRVEHINIEDDDYIVLDFLGKDSMRYYNRIKVDHKIHENLKKFIKGKEKSDNLFDLINASKLNDYLKSLMEDLSAKVFRTYNASYTLQQELNKKQFDDNNNVESKVVYYEEANKQVAILCNHQKTVSKNFNAQSESLQNFLKEHINYLMELTKHYEDMKKTKSKKQQKIEKKKNDKVDEEVDDQNPKNKLKKIFPDTMEKTEKYIDNLKSKISKLESKLRRKEEFKQIALGTSKLNYMDPRITVGWCKTNEVPIDKIFTKSIRDKFPWAMYCKPDYNF